jgi:Mn-dependent DtxR family transcriptional regulator
MVLTDAGEAVAAHIAHRHALLTLFLSQLGLTESVISRDVEGMEHHVSPETFAALERLTRHLESDPALREKLAAPS